jgi:hypothetical protein
MADIDVRTAVEKELREAREILQHHELPVHETINFGYNLLILTVLDQINEVGDAPTTLSQIVWTLQEAKKRTTQAWEESA